MLRLNLTLSETCSFGFCWVKIPIRGGRAMVQYKGGGGGGSVTRRWSREGGHSPTLQGMDKLAYFSARHKNYPFGQLFFLKNFSKLPKFLAHSEKCHLARGSQIPLGWDCTSFGRWGSCMATGYYWWAEPPLISPACFRLSHDHPGKGLANAFDKNISSSGIAGWTPPLWPKADIANTRLACGAGPLRPPPTSTMADGRAKITQFRLCLKKFTPAHSSLFQCSTEPLPPSSCVAAELKSGAEYHHP